VRFRAIRSKAELLDVLRDRREELNLSFATLNELAGLGDGYAEKLLSPRPSKQLGPDSLWGVLVALALGIAQVIIVEDPEQAARISGRWKPRKRAPKVNGCRRQKWDVAEPQPSFNFVNKEACECPKPD
jgi:hypothetical protein